MEVRFRQREQTDRGKVQEGSRRGGSGKGSRLTEGRGKGSRLTEGRIRQREQTDRGKVQAKGAD